MQLHKGIIKSVSLPLETVRAGDHCDLKISRQILPLLFIFGWYIFVVKAICNKKIKTNNIRVGLLHLESLSSLPSSHIRSANIFFTVLPASMVNMHTIAHLSSLISKIKLYRINFDQKTFFP